MRLFLSSYMLFSLLFFFSFFFFNDTATTEIYTLSLHDALPIYLSETRRFRRADDGTPRTRRSAWRVLRQGRSEEHTSELQSLRHLVCRLLLEKKKKKAQQIHTREPSPPHVNLPVLINADPRIDH